MRVQARIDAAIVDGKRVGRPPFGYTIEDGFPQQISSEYVRAQNVIREVRKADTGRSRDGRQHVVTYLHWHDHKWTPVASVETNTRVATSPTKRERTRAFHRVTAGFVAHEGISVL